MPRLPRAHTGHGAGRHWQNTTLHGGIMPAAISHANKKQKNWGAGCLGETKPTNLVRGGRMGESWEGEPKGITGRAGGHARTVRWGHAGINVG